MAELENNQDQAEEELTEVKQPSDGAVSGDKKPVKQGSSDAEKIESGKGEVVKPEENPVDKAVKSVSDAEDDVKPVKGDKQQKGADTAEKGSKLKEEEDSDEEVIEESKPSKMETIKAVVNTMKGMTKEELQKSFGDISEDEVDETLTKAEVARKIVETLKGMDEQDVSKFAEKFDTDEDEDVKESVEGDEDTPADVEADLIEIEVDDDLNAISEALDLSDENAEKAKTLFKAAVTSKVAVIVEELKSQHEKELETSVETVKGDLAEAVDKYLTYCAEEWTKENELAIERGLRSEMTENFIDGLKTLFVEHYVEVPEDKYDVMDELANRLDEMESKLDVEVQKNIDVTEELDSIKRGNVIREACEDLSESQKEKMTSLADGVDYKDGEDFAEKISEVKEAYFGANSDGIATETNVEEGTGTFEDEASSETILDPTIAKYSEAISKLKPL